MSSREEYEKIDVMIDSGASDTAASVEKFESYPIDKTTAPGTAYSSAAGKQAEDIVIVGQRYIRVTDEHITESWTKFRTFGGVQTRRVTYKTTPTATGRTCGSTMGSNYVDLWVKRKPTSTCTETNVRFSRAGHVTNEKPSIGAQRIGAGAQRVGAECVEQLGFPCWPSVWHCALPYQGDCFFGGVAVACVSRCGATEVGALRAWMSTLQSMRDAASRGAQSSRRLAKR